jgi:uncharacterized protein (TIGR02453 family)
VATFSGFSDRAIEFYDGLEADNSKAYWTEHKAAYESEVRDPMRALLDALEPEFGAGKLFRPYRDVRFSADKSPYKTRQGAVAGPSVGVGYYVQIGPDGLLVGGGFRSHSTAQTDRYRRAVADEQAGEQLRSIVAELTATGFEIAGEQLKTRPRGYDADHPRIDLLRHKSLMAIRSFGAPGWLSTARALDEVRGGWRALMPLSEWVDANVGPA